jgi:hypothetical protein
MKKQSIPIADFFKEINSLLKYKPKPKTNDNINVSNCSRDDIRPDPDSRDYHEPSEKK